MKKQSAGILLYRSRAGKLEVLLCHAGGPFWAKKDTGAWSIPKGEADEGETDLLQVAKREFHEETGYKAPDGSYIELDSFDRKDKIISAWAIEGDLDVATVKSNTFEMEWPPKSGKQQAFPEIDKARWFELSVTQPKLHTGQYVFMERLAEKLGLDLSGPPEQQSLL